MSSFDRNQMGWRPVYKLQMGSEIERWNPVYNLYTGRHPVRFIFS